MTRRHEGWEAALAQERLDVRELRFLAQIAKELISPRRAEPRPPGRLPPAALHA